MPDPSTSTTAQEAQARAALEHIVDRLIAANTDVVDQLNATFSGDAVQGQWIDHAVGQKSEEFGEVLAAASEPLSEVEQRVLSELEATIKTMYAEHPELAELPVETVQEWILSELAAE